MDDLARYNKERWEALAAANVAYSRPRLDLTVETARLRVDPHGMMGDVDGARVLCLAAGGGQQSAAFALLGAQVTVLDLSETQIERDRSTLAHYGRAAVLEQGDMRDLSRFDNAAFDVVYHAFSINFVPDAGVVFNQVRRVLRPRGLYYLECHNPFVVGAEASDWNGEGYVIKRRYQDGEIRFDHDYWEVEGADGSLHQIEAPREFNHTLSTLLNGLARREFALLGLWEQTSHHPDAEPGTWEHQKAYSPPT